MKGAKCWLLGEDSRVLVPSKSGGCRNQVKELCVHARLVRMLALALVTKAPYLVPVLASRWVGGQVGKGTREMQA